MMQERKKRGRKKKSLYENIQTFLCKMREKFPEGCNKSTVFIMASDGEKFSSLFGGDDDVMRYMIANVTLKDDEIRNVVSEGLLSSINLLTGSEYEV